MDVSTGRGANKLLLRGQSPGTEGKKREREIAGEMPWHDNGCLASRILSRCLRAATRCASIRRIRGPPPRARRRGEESTVKQIEINGKRLLFSPLHCTGARSEMKICGPACGEPQDNSERRETLVRKTRGKTQLLAAVEETTLFLPVLRNRANASVRLIKTFVCNVTEIQISFSN